LTNRKSADAGLTFSRTFRHFHINCRCLL
jgi:hypothetical protein